MNNLARKATLELYNTEDLKDIVRFDSIVSLLEQADKSHNDALLKRLPELSEHPEPDMEYENYRDSVDDDFRVAAESQGMSEEQIDNRLSDWDDEMKQDYVHDWDVANNMWK
jgi:hypothetical protein